MRIDLPGCNLKTCRYCQDHNCIDKNRYETCDYARLSNEEYTANLEGITNYQKLQRIFPHIASSGMAMRICPGALYGFNICPCVPFDINTTKDLWEHYDADNDWCKHCAKIFWSSVYNGAEDIKELKSKLEVTYRG